MKIVLNAEPKGYSHNAILSWTDKGYIYKESSWEEIDYIKYNYDVEILIVRLAKKVDNTILKKFPNLTHIVTATTGLDHIDIDSVNTLGIKLVSLKNHLNFLKKIPSTAELTWALLMSLLRNIILANEDVKRGFWDRDKFIGNQLRGKKIGIIGLGRTGKFIARYAKAFRMNIYYYDPYINDKVGIKVEKLEELLEICDIITIHVHLNNETKHLLNSKNLSKLKHNSIIINTSRGKIIDEFSLEQLFSNKIISGFASDVLYDEFSDIKQNPLWNLQNKGYNIIITPHIGGATIEAMQLCEEFIIKYVK